MTDTRDGVIQLTIPDANIPADEPERTDFETELEWAVREAIQSNEELYSLLRDTEVQTDTQFTE